MSGFGWPAPGRTWEKCCRTRMIRYRRCRRSRLHWRRSRSDSGDFTEPGVRQTYPAIAGRRLPTELTTEAAVTLEPEGKGFRITRSALTLRAEVRNLDETKFAEIAEKNCPVSKVLDAEITLDAKLI